MTSTDFSAAARRRYQKASLWTRVRMHPAGPIGILFSLVLAGCIVVGLLFPDKFFFLRSSNIQLILRSIPNFGIVALGVGILMIAGEFDLSVGATYVAAPFMMALAYSVGVPLLPSILIALIMAATIGLINATITLRFGIPSFIATIGMMFIVRTATPFMVPYDSRSVRFAPPAEIKAIFTGKLLGIPAQFYWFIGLALFAYVLMNRHFLGNHFFSTGGDARAARFSGIKVVRVKTIAFMIASVFASIAGILAVFRTRAASTEPQFQIELFAVAICVMGGLSLFGGRGAILGIVLGAAVLQLVQDVIILARLPGFYLDMFLGIMIVAAVVVNQIARRTY